MSVQVGLPMTQCGYSRRISPGRRSRLSGETTRRGRHAGRCDEIDTVRLESKKRWGWSGPIMARRQRASGNMLKFCRHVLENIHRKSPQSEVVLIGRSWTKMNSGWIWSAQKIDSQIESIVWMLPKFELPYRAGILRAITMKIWQNMNDGIFGRMSDLTSSLLLPKFHEFLSSSHNT